MVTATKAILVVEPDEGMAEFLTQLLEQEDYRVVAVGSLQDAVNLLSRTPFDLIITEAFYQQDAFRFDPAFLSPLKSAAGRTPIILCSIYPSTDFLRASEFGLAEVVPKPFEIDQLLGKISRVLENNGRKALLNRV